jgi:hypothetical protein
MVILKVPSLLRCSVKMGATKKPAPMMAMMTARTVTATAP